MNRFLIFTLLLNICSINCLKQNEYQNRLINSINKIKSFNSESKKNLLQNLNNYELIRNSFKDYVDKLDVSTLALPNVTQGCLVQVVTFLPALQKFQPWALSFIDSFGKPPSGILLGDTMWYGEFSECLKIKEPESDINGKYFLFGNPAPALPLQPASPQVGLCLPDKCTGQDVVSIINFAIDQIPANITKFLPFNITKVDPSFVNAHETAEFDTKASVAIVIVSILVGLVVIGTIYELGKIYEKNHRQKEILTYRVHTNSDNEESKDDSIAQIHEDHEPIFLKILLSFSAYTNSKKLFTVTKSNDQLGSIHGIRFLSLAWVILGHNFLFTTPANPAIVPEWFKRFSFLVVSNAFFSVDSFFLISGLLTAYVFIREVEKRKAISFGLMAKFYIHRFWRITPPYMLVILVASCLTQFVGDGPSYNKEGFEPFCKDTWWTNLLYVNNFVKTDKGCLSVSWYLANDMQFHWISPIFLIPFALGKRYIALVLSIVFICVNVIVTAVVLNEHPGAEGGVLSLGALDFFKYVYIKPWCRIGPFVVGILLGYYINICKKNPDFKLRNIYNTIGWLLSLFTLGLMLFGIYPNFNGNPLTRVENILYQSTSRILWAFALGFIIFSCSMKKGGFVNDILCWTVWVPLSRLSFCAYLIHVQFLTYHTQVQEHNIFFQDINLIYNYIGTLVLAYMGAFFVSLTFEVPLLGLEKFIFKHKKH